MKIYDCFVFFNELDILEIRLNELYNSVDYFVLVESKFSFSNNPKPLFYEENKERFAKFKDKIIHIIIDKFQDSTDLPRIDGLHHNWTREEEQGRMIIKGLEQAKEEDIICVSDVDEIINHKLFEYIRANGIEQDTITQVSLLMYKFKLNYLFQDSRNLLYQSEKHFKDLLQHIPELANASPWQAPGICTFKTLKRYCNNDPRLVRAYAKPYNTYKTQNKEQPKLTYIKNILGGWHLCSMSDLIYKLRNFSHSSEISKNTDTEVLEFISQQLITRTKNISINNNYNDSYPKFIIDNIQKFIDLGWIITDTYEHFYKNIDGWFTFPELYNMFVERMNDGGKIAEVGVWKGKSICYLGIIIKNSKKRITVYAVDTWKKMEKEHYQKDEDFQNDIMYTSFINNILPISDIVIPKRGASIDICKEFSDQYFDVVFIDACHDYESVKQDILCWLPKVKNNGIIAGHDYPFESVRKAVHEIFENTHKINSQEQCWWIELNS